jgi:dihydrofolate reductase
VKLSLIAAVARNGALGKDNALLWHLPEDLKFFRRMTQGCPVIMGRKTWDSLPVKFRPLPGRRNVVLTRQADWQAEGAETVRSLDDALQRLAGADKVFVIGGAQLYAQALPRADELVLTEIHQDFDADVHFPDWPREQFAEIQREDHPAEQPQALGWSWVVYRRR